ncbi:hypothetical protein E2C01_035027 [Portunus trituberculatus]|uniref:Uncharacterized protein n=1 Tax=Portunus trituberculatus TaxID=210409 RepID=A0A5B7F7B9_PORTR|nr:hypothetical protein [Portunus trituberculatus]
MITLRVQVTISYGGKRPQCISVVAKDGGALLFPYRSELACVPLYTAGWRCVPYDRGAWLWSPNPARDLAIGQPSSLAMIMGEIANQYTASGQFEAGDGSTAAQLADSAWRRTRCFVCQGKTAGGVVRTILTAGRTVGAFWVARSAISAIWRLGVVTALVVVIVAGVACRGVGAFSLGRLFPASRRGPRVPLPVTDSPIYYIRLPPSPYVYMPGLGYVSPNRNHFTFLRPDVNFVNNGKPTNVFHFKAPVTTPYFHTTTPSTTTTSTTTTTTTTTPRPTTAKPQKPPTTKKPSPITWLTGPWFFNGRPSNLFIYRSPYNPGHLDKLHKTYSKPGVYVK